MIWVNIFVRLKDGRKQVIKGSDRGADGVP